MSNEFYLDYQRAGHRYMSDGDYGRAVEAYCHAVSLNPTDLVSIAKLSEFACARAEPSVARLLQSVRDKALIEVGKKTSCLHLAPFISIINRRLMQAHLRHGTAGSVTLPADGHRGIGPPRLLLLTCVWKRPALTRIVLEYYKTLQAKLAPELDLRLLAVGSEGAASEALCRNAGFDYREHPNEPLSAKWERGITEAFYYDPDAVVIVGSDDLISENLFRKYVSCLQSGDMFVGLTDGYFFNLVGEDMVYWKGYGGRARAGGQPQRLGETIGMGRLLSRALLEVLGYSIWKDASISKGLDKHMKERVAELGMLPVRYADKVQEFSQTGTPTNWGQLGIRLENADAMSVDVKYELSVTPFRKYLNGGGTCERLHDPWEIMTRFFPEETLAGLRRLKG